MAETNKTGKTKKNYFNLKALNKVLFVLIVFLVVYYIAGANDLMVKGIALSDLKAERDKLAKENNNLELTAMTLSSFGAVKERVSGLKMVAVGEVRYLNGAVEAVAKK